MSQADQNISNDTGSNVRADINSNLSALFSNNSGAAAPATTTAFMWWADTANDALKIRNSADDGFVTVGTLSATNLGMATLASPTFTGNVSVPAGTVSSLPIRFTGDTDTGFFKDNDDDFSVVTGGTRRVHFDSDGITIRDRKALRLRDTSNSNFIAIQAPSNLASDLTLTLPTSDGNANDVLQSDGSGNLSFTALPQAVPSGSVFMFATTTAPSGYLKCNGAAVSRTTYAALFAVIGTTHGAGDGSTTFNVPDLRGEFVRGWDDSRGVDSGRGFGTFQGQNYQSHQHGSGNLTTDTHGGHFHGPSNQGGFDNLGNGQPLRAVYEDGATFNGITYDLSAGAHNHAVNGGATSFSGSTETRPRNIAMMYVIKT